MVLPIMAQPNAARLVEAHFEYVKMVKLISDECLLHAQVFARSQSSRQTAIDVTRCYSFLLEKRERMQHEFIDRLNRLKFTEGALTDKEKEFIALVFFIDQNLQEIAATVEPIYQKYRQ